MAVYTRSVAWWSWTGTLADLADAMDDAEREMTAVQGEPPNLTIRIEEAGLAASHLTMDELRHYEPMSRMRSIEQIVIEVEGGKYPIQTTVELRVTAAIPSLIPPVRLSIRGPDRTWVEGVTTRIDRKLSRGKRIARRYKSGIHGAVMFAASVVISVAAASLLQAYGVGHHWRTVSLVTLWLSAGVVAALAAAVWWSIPGLELLRAGDPRRGQRLKAVVVGLMVALVAAIAATLLFAAVPVG